MRKGFERERERKRKHLDSLVWWVGSLQVVLIWGTWGCCILLEKERKKRVHFLLFGGLGWIVGPHL
jgi:hypothetical protein